MAKVKESEEKATPKKRKSLKSEPLNLESEEEKEIEEQPLFAKEPYNKPQKKLESFSSETIISDLSELKVKISKKLQDLESSLLEKAKIVEDLEKEIEDKRKTLKELYDIEVEAGTLEKLIKSQEEKRITFEAKIAEEKARWEEQISSMKREREREEEEYEYKTKLKHQREEQEFKDRLEKEKKSYEEKKAIEEQELSKREEIISLKENELISLRERVSQFDEILSKEIGEAEKRGISSAEERMRVEKIILEKDIEKEKELYKLTLKTLEEKVKEQEARIKSLEKDLKDLLAQSQSVASKAIEGIAGFKNSPPPEKT